MATTVYGSLVAVNELVVEAGESAESSNVPEWWFSCVADDVARGQLEDADEVLAKIEDVVDEQAVLTPLRNARQLLLPLKEDWA